VPKRNYGFEKRQKELAKQEKRAAKLLRRRERSDTSDQPGDEPLSQEPLPPDPGTQD
jgi:hypothetical protein